MSRTPDYLSFVTHEQAERLKGRIFRINKENVFTFDQILIDLDTVYLYYDHDQINLIFYAAFAFSHKNRAGGKLNHGANVQLINMVYDQAEREWLVRTAGWSPM